MTQPKTPTVAESRAAGLVAAAILVSRGELTTTQPGDDGLCPIAKSALEAWGKRAKALSLPINQGHWDAFLDSFVDEARRLIHRRNELIAEEAGHANP